MHSIHCTNLFAMRLLDDPSRLVTALPASRPPMGSIDISPSSLSTHSHYGHLQRIERLQ